MSDKPRPPSPFEPLLEDLLDAGARVVGRAIKRGAAAVVGSALEDVQKAGGELGRRIEHARAKIAARLHEIQNDEEKN